MSLPWAIWAVQLTCVGEVNMSALTVLYRSSPTASHAHAEGGSIQQRGKGRGDHVFYHGPVGCTACVLVQ
jgi:hypothetical protein